jgi:hypothetical protein
MQKVQCRWFTGHVQCKLQLWIKSSHELMSDTPAPVQHAQTHNLQRQQFTTEVSRSKHCRDDRAALTVPTSVAKPDIVLAQPSPQFAA